MFTEIVIFKFQPRIVSQNYEGFACKILYFSGTKLITPRAINFNLYVKYYLTSISGIKPNSTRRNRSLTKYKVFQLYGFVRILYHFMIPPWRIRHITWRIIYIRCFKFQSMWWFKFQINISPCFYFFVVLFLTFQTGINWNFRN